MNTTNVSSVGSTQKAVPPAPPQDHSPGSPIDAGPPRAVRTATPRPKPEPGPGR